MGFWQNLLSSFRGSGAAFFTPNVTHLGAAEIAAMMDPSKMTPVQMWETQPHFRTVVSFLARNIAQLGLHVFERDGDDRHRDRTSVLARTIRDTDGTMTAYELVFSLVGDLALYDRAYWMVVQSADRPSGWMIRRLPPTWVEPVMANAWEVKHYLVYMRADGRAEKIAPDKVVAFPGYHPGKMHGASPTVDSLRETLQEQVEAAKYRAQVWKRGGRVSSVIERPRDAPEWSKEARDSFREDWYAKYTGRGSRAGGTPILEDGMQLRRIDFNAQEQQFVEAAKLSLRTVAAAFHVNPTMIGDNEGASYSNVREFRKMLYGDTLGPLVAQIEARLNGFLVPMLGTDSETFFVEFNIEEKLQGNFEEQAQALSASVGLPYMTRNEARAIRNLPAIEDGDGLGIPLNYLIGGQMPSRAGEQNSTGTPAPSGGGSAPVEPDERPGETASGFTPDEIMQLVNAATALIRAGFAPKECLIAVGLDPVEHLGLLPVTVQRPERAENPDEETEEALKAAAAVHAKAMARRRSSKGGGPRLSRESARDPLHIKSDSREQDEAAVEQVLRRFFARQRRVVLTELGSKDAAWWDEDRWNTELADDLYGLAVSVSAEIGQETAEALGFDADMYDVGRTERFLRAVAESRAGAINSTTRDQIQAALDGDVSDGAQRGSPEGVFDQAEGSRASVASATLATTLATFAVTEFGRQLNRPSTTKTWVVTSGNPRPSHAAMNGETVDIEGKFSNGADWPGDPAAGVNEVAGCSCVVDITVGAE